MSDEKCMTIWRDEDETRMMETAKGIREAEVEQITRG